MLGPRFLPRTLRGAGGIRLIDMPGVRYPESVLHGPKGADTASGKAHREPPRWGVSSRQAAEMLGVSPRTARALLNRNRAKFQLVAQKGSPACLYWDRRVVQRLAAKRLPLVTKIPDRLCSAREACYILLVARSTLMRYVKMKLLKEYPIRHVTPTGVRKLSYYLRADVRKLAGKRNAARARAEEARRERMQQWWVKQKDSLIPPPCVME